MTGTLTARRWGRPGGRRPAALVLVTLLGLLASLVALVGPLAGQALAEDGVWDASGPTGTIEDVNDGSLSAAQLKYRSVDQGFAEQTWELSTTYAPPPPEGEEEPVGRTVSVPWTWQGFHAYFDVTVRLRPFVEYDGERQYLEVPVDVSGVSCCTPPSGGFLYTGVTTFDVQPGATYGYELTGRNGDSTNVLRGTFTLSNRPYLEALGSDNRDWTGALALDPSRQQAFKQPGESRWYKIPVIPGQQVTVDLEGSGGGNLPADYDLALYGDIGQAFDRLTNANDLNQAAAQSSAAADTQVPLYPELVQNVPDASNPPVPGPTFAPRAYAPRAYAPRAYAPRAYAPRAYAPGIYSPSAFTSFPDASDGFRNAFTTAQSQSLISVSSLTGRNPEVLTARSGNTSGFYYVRVQGHGAEDFSADDYRVRATISGGAACQDVAPSLASIWPEDVPSDVDPATVVVTDSSRVEYDSGDATTLRSSLDELAAATDGVVLDVATSPRVRALWRQAVEEEACPYAVNLVAEAIDDLVSEYQQGPSARYVVVAGGDEVVPFLRYPDVSGLGQESQFSDTMRAESPAGQSLLKDQVLGQDAYGSQTEVTVGGAVFPVPDLAVGRLVKKASEIRATVDHFVDGTTVRDLPTPTSSLVTGYDFLADAAEAMDTEFRGAMNLSADDPAADRLVEQPGTPYDASWTGSDLAEKLRTRHSLTYLAGHFSANDTLAADFETTFSAAALKGSEYDLSDSLVLSAGCHSGYGIVDADAANPGDTYDWPQAMANEKAVLVAGTGYQYGDTEFLEYSERLYVGLTRNLRRGTPGTAVPVGEALADAKRDYLATVTSATGIDQKVVLQATMYGLPMVGLDVPGRANPSSGDPQVSPEDVTSGPGQSFGLSVADGSYSNRLSEDGRDRPPGAEGAGGQGLAAAAAGDTLPDRLTWLEDSDGVSVQPGMPVLPKRVVDVSVPHEVLRGVGFRGGTYTDRSGVLPLTGAPGIEGSTSHTTFESDRFWPEKPWATNYFDAFGRRGERGRTSLIVTRAQHRSDAPGSLTNTRRTYGSLDLDLFYSNNVEAFTGNPAFQAAAPAVTDVVGTEAGGVVTFSARVTGDPAAGVQKVWVTWTGTGSDSGYGRWESVDLVQDPLDSARWTGTLPLPAGQTRDGMRFVVQAVNGVGAVSLDAGEGAADSDRDGYQGGAVLVDDVAMTAANTPGPDGTIGSFGDLGVVLTGRRVQGRAVSFTATTPSGRELTSLGFTDDSGAVRMPVPYRLDGATLVPETLPVGQLSVVAAVQPLDNLPLPNPAPVVTTTVTASPPVLTADRTSLQAAAGAVYPTTRVRLSAAGRGLAGRTVTFALPPGCGATFDGKLRTRTATTDANGWVTVPRITAGTAVGSFALTVSTPGAVDLRLPMATQYALTPFSAPVSGSGTVTTTRTGTVPLKTTAMVGRTKLADSAAQALVTQRRIEVSWVRQGTSTVLGRRTDLTRYDAAKDFFQSDLKPSTLGMSARTTYVVTVRVLDSVAGSPVDLGSRSMTIKVS